MTSDVDTWLVSGYITGAQGMCRKREEVPMKKFVFAALAVALTGLVVADAQAGNSPGLFARLRARKECKQCSKCENCATCTSCTVVTTKTETKTTTTVEKKAAPSPVVEKAAASKAQAPASPVQKKAAPSIR